MTERKESCHWIQDDESGMFATACKQYWEFTNDGPIENDCNFCPHCGGRLTFDLYEPVHEQQCQCERVEVSSFAGEGPVICTKCGGRRDSEEPAQNPICMKCGKSVSVIQVAATKGGKPICLKCFYVDDDSEEPTQE